MIVRKCLEEERGHKNLTKEALSRKLGITSRTYRNYLFGSPIPSDKLIAMADLFGCSTDYILGRTVEREGRAG